MHLPSLKLGRGTDHRTEALWHSKKLALGGLAIHFPSLKLGRRPTKPGAERGSFANPGGRTGVRSYRGRGLFWSGGSALLFFK